MLDALQLNLQSTEHDLGDAETEIAIAQSRHLDAPTIELFRRDLVGAREAQEARRLTTRETCPAASPRTRRSRRTCCCTNPLRGRAGPITHPPAKKKRPSPAAR